MANTYQINSSAGVYYVLSDTRFVFCVLDIMSVLRKITLL